MLAIIPKRIFDGHKFHSNSALMIQDQKIIGRCRIETLPENIKIHHFKDATLVPGFIDLQVNGGGGVMFNQETTFEGIAKICSAHRNYGTTHLLPTLISDSKTQITNALRATQLAISKGINEVLGVHLEGPWLNQIKKGAHDSNLFHSPSHTEISNYPWLTNGKVLCTVAPEMLSIEQLQILKQHDIIIFAGHSDATFNEFLSEKSSLISGFTHLFNAMSPLTGREPGVVGAAFSLNHAACSIIADGIHVHPSNILNAHKIKPHSKLFLVTDAMASVGSLNNSFLLNGEEITVENNTLINEQGNLAGAHIGMDASVANLIKWGIEEGEAYRMAGYYPAKAINVDDKLGLIQPGYQASLTLLSSDNTCIATYVNGTRYDSKR